MSVLERDRGFYLFSCDRCGSVTREESMDPNALEKVRELILREGGKVVYSVGPTEKFLWILSGSNPSEGKGRDATNR